MSPYALPPPILKEREIGMNRKICPYLGLKDDPSTALDFPSQGNFCHHASPVAPVNGTYQQQYCLSAEHTACPLFKAAEPKRMPAAMLLKANSNALSRQRLRILSIPLLIVGTTVLGLLWNTVNTNLVQAKLISNTGKDGSMPGGWSLLATRLPI